jgi:hypothetical protein
LAADSLTYSSGEEVQAGDRILCHGEPGDVEFVATPEAAEHRWYVEQFGVGCMLVVPSFGNVYMPKSDLELQFVGRNAG